LGVHLGAEAELDVAAAGGAVVPAAALGGDEVVVHGRHVLVVEVQAAVGSTASAPVVARRSVAA
jgi:D-aminopeptidase